MTLQVRHWSTDRNHKSMPWSGGGDVVQNPRHKLLGTIWSPGRSDYGICQLFLGNYCVGNSQPKCPEAYSSKQSQ